MIGQTISHYKILAKLGEGGMGVVYKAEDIKLKRSVALKFLAPHLLRDEEGRKRFLREAQAAAALDHPNICTVHEIDEADGRTFIAMAFLEGEPLSQKIKQGPLKIPEALSIAIQVAEGLEAAHEKGITHRDIKPDNIMLMAGSRGLAKIMDFGLAQLAGSSKFTREGTTLGTMLYMSPEQAGGAETDRRTDIWSLGVVLYEMIAGQPPFRGEFDQALVYSLMNEPPEPLTAVRTGVPKELERIVNKCLAKKPEQRYQHADELLVDLQALRTELEPHTSRVAAKPDAKRTSPAIVGVVAVVVLGALGFGWWFGRSSERTEEGPPPTSVPLTSFPGNELQPAFSPNGEDVAFVWNGEQQDDYNIYVRRLGTQSSPLRLTSHPDADFNPAWSPDGREIAFMRRGEVLIVPALGGPERKIATASPFRDSQGDVWLPGRGPAWSPDGKLLAIVDPVSPQEPMGILSLSIGTREKQRLTSPPPGQEFARDSHPAFSPDGRHLAFARFSSAWVADIHVLPLSHDGTPSGEARRLTRDERDIQGLDWAPDGRSVVFSSNRQGGQRLWRIALSGGEPEPLGVVGEGASWPAVSRQGSRLAYVRSSQDRNIWRSILPLRADREPAAPAPLIVSTRNDVGPNYSPDGKKIVFDSNRSGSEEIWVCDSDGTNPVQLTFFGGPPVGVPRWSPDGEWIAFDSRKEGDADVYVIAASGGAPRRLTMHPGYDARPSWSQDGRWIYFVSRRGGDLQIWKIAAEGGEAVQVTRNGGRQAFESTDGRFVYYVKPGMNGVWKMPVEGGEEQKVLDKGFVGRWALLKEGICLLDVPTRTIQFFDFGTRRAEPVVILPEHVRLFADSFAVSPDGLWVLYVQSDFAERDIMLVENFR